MRASRPGGGAIPGPGPRPTCQRGPRTRRTARGRRLPGRGRRASGRPPTGLDRPCASRGSCRHGRRARPAPRRAARRPMTTSPLAYFWGDDELSAARAVDRLEAALTAETGAPMERWTLRGDRNAAAGLIADLNERVATPVMFGGGTLAVVSNPGALTVKNEHRDAFLAAVGLVAPGNGLVVLEASPSGAKAPAQRKLAEAVRAAGGTVRGFPSPKRRRARRLDRGRGTRTRAHARARHGEGPRGADRWLRPGGRRRAAPADPYRVDGARQAGALPRHGADRSRRRRGPRRGGGPGLGLGLHRCRRDAPPEKALALLERLLEATPEPVLLAVLHRRVRELLELGDRLGGGRAARGRGQGDGRQQRIPRRAPPGAGEAAGRPTS